MNSLLSIPVSLESQISRYRVSVSNSELKTMIGLIRALHRLSCNPVYREFVSAELPLAAQFDPGHNSVMMGYDFHLTDTGPKLIEVNTNAGGAIMAYGAARRGSSVHLNDRSVQRCIDSFTKEYRLYLTGGSIKTVAIVDEDPSSQFLYSEMELYVQLFAQVGIEAVVVDPEELNGTADGVTFQGRKIDLIYNRHCDFYLESEALAGIRSAYLARTVCLTPNPRQYGLLADKGRMISWSDPAFIERCNLSPRDAALIDQTIPMTRLLADCDLEQIWEERKWLIFKPAVGFGSRGVLAGRKVSRKRFSELPPQETLAQEYCPPSTIDTEEGEMKVDVRLFAYADRVLGVTSRIYQGQVTNMRTTGGGFAAVTVRAGN